MKEKIRTWIRLWRLKKAYRRYCRQENAEAPGVMKTEYEKYKKMLKEDRRADLAAVQADEFFRDSISLVSDRLRLSDDRTDPVLVVVVKNELPRLKILYPHYRKLGVRQFIFIDNGSADGSLEYLRSLPDTRIYSADTEFQTQKKEAWIEKVLALTGYGRWYLVADSDELMDYPGSGDKTAREIVRIAESEGYDRVMGILLDMYSREPLFTVPAAKQDMCCYFDKDTYVMHERTDENNEITGGPRARVLGIKNAQSKQALFRFDQEMIFRNCHYLLPVNKHVPCWYVLRHYKFLKEDRTEYALRAEKQNFYGGSKDYRSVIRRTECGEPVSFYYEGSAEYTGPESLAGIRFLESLFLQTEEETS